MRNSDEAGKIYSEAQRFVQRQMLLYCITSEWYISAPGRYEFRNSMFSTTRMPLLSPIEMEIAQELTGV